MLIVGICGKAGSGKDTVADILVKDHGFVKVAFADPLKRICQELFEFTSDQLWGPSEKRNEPDFRYCRTPHQAGWDPVDGRPTSIDAEYLTPRYALQKLGTEWGRDCYPDIWIEYAMRVAKRLLANPAGSPIYYDAKQGIRGRYMSDPEVRGVVISDVRFLNEVEGLKKRGARLVRIHRNTAKGLSGAAARHRSEIEQDGIKDELFDYILDNNGSLEDLVTLTNGFLSSFQIEERDADFANMLSSIGEPEKQSIIQRASEAAVALQDEVEATLRPVQPEIVEVPLAPLLAVTTDGAQVLPSEPPAQQHLRGLLEDRQRDVEAGKILELDESQKDIPPFKRVKR